MQKITSKDNSIVKKIIKLNKSAKTRNTEGLFVTEGTRLCLEALKSKFVIEYVCFSESFYSRSYDICLKFKEKCQCFIFSDSLFANICDTQSPQGVLCVIKTLDKHQYSGTIKLDGKILTLENLQDPNNMGTILRTAEAFGIDTIVLTSNCCDIYSPKVVRGSMGAIFRQEFLITDDLPNLLINYNRYATSYAAVLDSTSVPVTEVDFCQNCMAIIGNEGNGITKQVADLSTHKIIIPMAGGAESLNAAIASSILMWEMVR